MATGGLKLEKAGYKWIRVSRMLEETPPVTAYCQHNERFPGYEGLWCKLIMAATSYAMTKKTVAVIHGPTNCSWAIRNFCSTNYSLYYGNPFLHAVSSCIDGNSIISGGTDSLYKTILAVDRDYKPEHICVFDTCSTALTSDDIETSILEAQKIIAAKINYIPSAGFTSIPLGKSIEEISAKYADMMEFPQGIEEDTVNILGQYKEQHEANPLQKPKNCSGAIAKHGKKQGGCSLSRGKYPDDASELSRMIEALGLKVHRVLISGDIDYIKTAPQAQVNVISCPTWGIPLAQKMEKRFKTPYLRHCVPTGIESTSRWIRELAFYCGKSQDAEEFIEKETSRIKETFEKVKLLVKGKLALVECGRNSQTAFARPMALANALQELGMTPYLFGIHPLEMKAKDIDAQYFLWDGFNPMILSGDYPFQQPIDVLEVAKSLESFAELGIRKNDFIYFTQDVFPMEKAGYFDSSEFPKVETGVHLRRVVNSPGRAVGFRGAEALYKSIIEAVMLSSFNKIPSLYSRVHGEFFVK